MSPIILCLLVGFVLKSSFAYVLQIEDGRIEGTTLTTRLGQEFLAFRNVPFAEPPIGDLRFRAPVAKQPWSDVLNCTAYGPMCMQDSDWGIAMSEDCLTVNVFSKNIPQSGDLKPVIAYIHGGGFEAGSSVEADPNYLMERDLVVVTISYRLGAFGFLALGTEDAAGNQGLKDQALALQWIRKNIAHFGGDPSKVTIAGLSAGGHCVTAHMISPISQGLFANVIAVSGAIAWQKKLTTNNLPVAAGLAERLNCTTTTVADVLSCLKEATAADIARNMIFQFFKCPVMSWLPVVEPNFGQERFLADEPNDLWRSGNFSKVNVMTGVTADEFIQPVADILKDEQLTQDLNEVFDEIAPSCFFFEANDHLSSSEISQVLRKSYLPFDKIDLRSFNALNHLFADGVIGYGVHRFVHFVSSSIPVFYYKFSYVGSHSIFKYPRNTSYGVHHADDIQYVFKSDFIGSIEMTDSENLMVQRMTRMWENFAKTGNPTNPLDEYLSEVVWPKHDAEEEYFLDIGNNMVEKNGLFLERYVVWDRIESSASTGKSSVVAVACLLLFKAFL